jgi:SOS-response transcriptional repressor LexA
MRRDPDALSERQERVLEMFVRTTRAGLPAPSIREICAALGITSTNAASEHLRALAKKGWLVSGTKGTARSRSLSRKARTYYKLPQPTGLTDVEREAFLRACGARP